MAVYGFSAIALLFGALLLLALRAESCSGLQQSLRSRFLVAAGKYSYALYMVHVPVASLTDKALTQRLAAWLPRWPYLLRYFLLLTIVFVVSWTLAIASWHFFEKHILALKSRFSYSANSPTPTSAEKSGIPIGATPALSAERQAEP
jgi:peptidoglycan/LPS O-acetylase OafA/YrhL